jgi:hypothetical protein
MGSIAAAGLVMLAVVAAGSASPAQVLKRRVDTGMAFDDFAPGRGLPIARVEPGSAADRAGVRVGDAAVGLGRQLFADGLDAEARLAALRAGEPATLVLSRDGVRRTIRTAFPPLPRDAAPGVEFSYEQVRNPRSGLLQRVIVSRPRGAGERLPAVFFIPWLSCDSVEVPEGRRGGSETLLYRIATESGLVLMRVEKPGVGDSEGVCSETDLDTELAGNRAAFAALRRRHGTATARACRRPSRPPSCSGWKVPWGRGRRSRGRRGSHESLSGARDALGRAARAPPAPRSLSARSPEGNGARSA